MTHRTLWSLLLVVLSGLLPATTWAEPDLPPTPPGALSPTASVRLRTAYTAFLRAEPVWRHDGDREVLARGTEVEVRAVVPDGSERLGGYWYQVEALPEGGAARTGWLHSTVVYLTPTQLVGLTPAASTTPTAAAASVVELHPATLPPAAPVTAPTAGPTITVPLALQVCYDLHANKTCDVDEGIAGVRVYGTDAATGQVVGTAVTDATGVAQFRWRAPDDTRARLTVTVPYFEEVRTVTPAQAKVDPVVVTALAPIPAWLP